MARKFKVFILFFALGLLVVPNQIFFAQNYEMSCCASETETKDCCKDENNKQPCNDSKENNCGGQCTSCGICHSTTVFFRTEDIKITITDVPNYVIKTEFSYITPEFSTAISKIWQPPKIS